MSDQSELKIEVSMQPRSVYRFRYRGEMGKMTSIDGMKYTRNKRHYPTIRIEGLKTTAHITVSCVTEEEPYKVHPNELRKVEGDLGLGIITGLIEPPSEEFELKDVGIIIIRRKEYALTLERRFRLSIDPFNQGLDHGSTPNLINSNSVRLCFEARVRDSTGLLCFKTLTPVVTEAIRNDTSEKYLAIEKFEPSTALIPGGTHLEIHTVRKFLKDIKVRFFTDTDDNQWVAVVDPLPRKANDRRMMVTVKSPPFHEPNLEYPIEVLVQLFRLNLTCFGEPSIIQLRPLQENKLFHNLIANLQSGITISKLPIPGENQLQPSSSVLSMDPPSNITNRLMPMEPQLVHYESENTSPVSDPFLGIPFEEDQQLIMPTIEPMIGPEADDYVTPDAWSYVDGAINWSLLFGHDHLEIAGEPIAGPSGLRSDTANRPFYPTNDEDSDD